MKKNVINHLFEEAYAFLLSSDSRVTKDLIEKQLSPAWNKPKDFKKIYIRFCESAQNRTFFSNIIGKSIGGVKELDKVLYGFDPCKVIKKYGNNPDVLFQDIKEVLKPKGELKSDKKSAWPKYCETILKTAQFLTDFDTADEFYKWADSLSSNSESKVSLPLFISIEIPGFGFALACDAIKELGYTEYGKPDTHLKGIFRELNLIERTACTDKQNIDTIKVIDKLAEINNRTAYAVDQILWLTGSGNLAGQKIKKSKTNFIQYMKDNYVLG
jgi:hypothetical protein